MKKEVLEKMKRILGEEHPDTISAMNNLASTLGDQGKLEESIAMLKSAYTKITILLGNYHPRSKVVCANLTQCLLGQFAEFFPQTPLDGEEELYHLTLSDFKRTFGSQHASTILLMKLIADIYQRQDQLDKAEQMYRQTLECSGDDFALENPFYCGLVSSLGKLYLRRGKWADAEEVFRQELRKHEEASGLEHATPMDTINGLYEVYVGRCMSLRQEQSARRRSKPIDLHDDIQARDVIAGLATAKSLAQFGLPFSAFSAGC